MSSTSARAAAPEPQHGARWNPSGRVAAVAGAALTIAIVVIVLIAHAVAGTPKPSTSAAASSSGGSMNMSSSSGSMGMSTPSSMPMPTAGKIETIRAASLPAMPTTAPAPMAMVPLGQSTWDGMRIDVRTSSPAIFELFDGTSQKLVRPTAKDSFHLMVSLADAETNYAIPYSSVWATIRKGSKIVFDERLWPMISRYMGPHFGNNVQLPSAGLYHLTLLVSPPVAARHIEYKGRWLKPHRVSLAFRWVPKT
jgi:Fe2+ transport protein